MCSSPHWPVGSSWFREKLSPANRNKGYRGEQISRKIVSRELNARSYRDLAKNIALLSATSAKFANSVGKKNGVQDATAIYPIPRYPRPRYIGFTLYLYHTTYWHWNISNYQGMWLNSLLTSDKENWGLKWYKMRANIFWKQVLPTP